MAQIPGDVPLMFADLRVVNPLFSNDIGYIPLVYTEEAGGSSPSPPTIFSRCFCARHTLDLRRTLLPIGMMVSVHTFEYLRGHPKSTSGFPDRNSILHHPCCSGVPEGVGSNA